MEPALVYLDPADGRLMFRTGMPPELRQLGIHHVVIAADGRVAISMQYEGPSADRVPLAAIQHGDGPIRLLDIPEPIVRGTRNYSGAVCLDVADRVLAATCPRGNQALFWDLADNRFLGRVATSDGCAVAAGDRPGGFVISNGTGGLIAIDALAAVRPSAVPLAGADAEGVFWDNHLALISA